MATLPLYVPTSTADAWHRVGSPGGYEWWYFDAEDTQHDRQIVAILFDGFVFHPGYLRKYGWYHRFPTRFEPPIAKDFRCAYFVVYEEGKLRSQFMTQFAAADFDASPHSPRVVLGKNQILPEDGRMRVNVEGTPWQLTWQGPKLLAGKKLSGQFTFKPILPHAPIEQIFLSKQLAGAEHHWVIANPLCEVEGEIHLPDGAAIPFKGRGYHDHNYGTSPLGRGLERWIWGRVLFDDSVMTFHFVRPRDSQLPDEVHLIRADAGGVFELQIGGVDFEGWGMTAAMLTYPKMITFGPGLRLKNPTVIDSSPFYLRVMYEAMCAGRTGRAFCEIAYPHRLRWPVLGRMIEMSIDKTGMVD